MTPKSATTKAVPINRFRFFFGISVMLLAVVWPFAAIWLHAHQHISNVTETRTAWLCMPGATFGAMLCWGGRKTENRWQVVLTILAAVLSALLGMAVVFASRVYSDRLFTYWVTNQIPDHAWQEMISDVENLAGGIEAGGEDRRVPPEYLAKSFSHLGCKNELNWSRVVNRGEGIMGGELTYGDRNRRWGFATGSEMFLEQFPARKFTRVPVATNACFFIGGDW